MRSLTRALAAGLVILGLLSLGAGVALAQGGGGSNSAGNSQYVDPLAGTGHHKGGSHNSTPSSSTTTTSTTSPTLSQSAPTAVGGTATTSTTSTQATSKTLPFTGLNLWGCVALGVGLLAAGIALRRALARAY